MLDGGNFHLGAVVRIGDTVHRPRARGADLTEAFLLHLERVGFGGAPRFLGHDDDGRQVLTFVEGIVTPDPPWMQDDEANAHQLGRVARLLRDLHEAGGGFDAPPGGPETRPMGLPLPGSVWNHGDAHYGNIVYQDGDPVALIDWDFVAEGDGCYDPLSLLVCARQPRLDRPDEQARREASAHLALEAVLDGYGATVVQRAAAPAGMAAVLDRAADYLEDLAASGHGGRTPSGSAGIVANRRALAAWWRTQPP